MADLLVLAGPRAVRSRPRAQARPPVEDVPRSEVPDWVRQTVRIKPVGTSDFAIPWEGGSARAIGLVTEQVVTESLEREPLVVNGHAMSDPERDLVKLAVVERHLATGRIGLGFLSGSGLQRGALASTVAHDAHNLVVVGATDEDMAFAVQRLADVGGGIVAVDGGAVVAECPLPVAGLLSDQPLDVVVGQSRACNDAAARLGWSGATPFLTLAFLALSVIPSLKLTDRGLVDVDRFELVPLRARRPMLYDPARFDRSHGDAWDEARVLAPRSARSSPTPTPRSTRTGSGPRTTGTRGRRRRRSRRSTWAPRA